MQKAVSSINAVFTTLHNHFKFNHFKFINYHGNRQSKPTTKLANMNNFFLPEVFFPERALSNPLVSLHSYDAVQSMPMHDLHLILPSLTAYILLINNTLSSKHAIHSTSPKKFYTRVEPTFKREASAALLLQRIQ